MPDVVVYGVSCASTRVARLHRLVDDALILRSGQAYLLWLLVVLQSADFVRFQAVVLLLGQRYSRYEHGPTLIVGQLLQRLDFSLAGVV